ncbi:MopE-related protein [Aestuariivivens insulae]|uniref:MopE-related protein n=1 Tax=Aestuariivivens insulae TaxID=1621988 RepID=UPI001F5928FD|nr:MopE-related protein [Aestuariivivens insulae]
MKNIYCFILLLFLVNSLSSQNCNSIILHETYMAGNSGYEEEITNTIVPGEYITITDIFTNNYTFTSYLGSTHDYITIRKTSDDTIIAEGTSPLNYTFQAGDIPDNSIKLIIHLDSTCDDTDNGNHTITLLNETNLPTCFVPENLKVTYLSNQRLDFTWDAPSTGSAPVGYEWEIGLPSFVPGTNAEEVKGTTTGTSASSGDVLDPNTDYEVAIRSDCGSGDYSIWYITPSLKTLPEDANPPQNDLCSGATILIQETGIADTSLATVVNGSVYGGAETNFSGENCDGNTVDNARDDVWYSFIAQTSDINIELIPDFNGILTLFSGDCNTLVDIACSDANGGLVPRDESIYYSNLTVGDTYYFRIYYQGFSTPNPNFEFKLWSSQSITDEDGDGYATNGGDCDDSNANLNPETVWYLDADSDNYAISTVVQCNSPGIGYTTDVLPVTDCNDNEPDSYPGNTEICDGIDNDCDGLMDDDDDSITGLNTYYRDNDLDGFGDASNAIQACSAPMGYVVDGTDCNDDESDSYPGNTEICDGIDNDCDGLVDDDDNGITGQNTYYRDNDSDSFGDANNAVQACSQPTGYVSNDTDCNDMEPNSFPGATEICDGMDNDCDGEVDEGFTDSDNDGVADCVDNCPNHSNPGQEDADDNGIGDACEGLSVEDLYLKDVRVEPNPFDSNIRVHLPQNYENIKIGIALFDLNGRVIYSDYQTSQNATLAIDSLSQLQNGIYLLKIYNHIGVVVKQVIKL